jgi:spermidine/putrescine transport system substrate-binding protein
MQSASAETACPNQGGDEMLKRFGTALTIAVAALTGSAEAAEIHILNWQGWGTDQPFAIAEFEKRSGVKVVHDYLTSFPEMFTKLRTNPGYYDIVVMNSAYTLSAADEGLIEAIDTSKLKNFGDLFPALRDTPYLNRDGKTYGVSWIWGATSVSYNTDKLKTPPDSVQVFWDPAHAKRVCWHDAPEDSVRMGALASGQDPEKPTDLNAIRDKLRALKPQINTFWKSEDEWLKLVAANECDVSFIWTDSTEKAKENFKLPITFFVPKEGALGWRDGLSIPANPQNKEAAYAFIDYMTSPEFYAGWAKAGGAPVTASTKAINELSADSLTRQVLTTPDSIARLKFQGPLTDEQRQSYLDLWQETKAYYAQ